MSALDLGSFAFGALAGTVAGVGALVYAALAHVRSRPFSVTIWRDRHDLAETPTYAHVSGHYGTVEIRHDAVLSGEDMRAVFTALGRLPVAEASEPKPPEPKQPSPPSPPAGGGAP